ncbi:MAG TPA: aminotransferase class V-fold PLP-dependent enzyme, partial [Gemmataceae bacterium]|nr:aminotransferase class V-fold PLP-dependent enzyme [Gemmataceae bacterium]
MNLNTFPVYMDNNSTTRTDPRVVEAMLPYFTEKYGNAASRSHPFGWEAESAVEEGREQIATLIGATAKEIIFTSGATESNNLALKGAAAMYKKKGNHIVTQATEHKAVLDTCKRLERDGFQVTYLPVDKFGQVSAEQVREAITDKTIIVSIMAANNEIGTVQPTAAIGKLCKEKGILFHTDAVQAVGKLPIDVEAMGIDLLSLTAHKIYGPKGVGALYVRKKDPRVRLEPQIDGGGHERGMRSGTLAVPLIVGLGAACEIARKEMPEETARTFRLREKLRKGIMDKLPESYLNGHPTERLPGSANISF